MTLMCSDDKISLLSLNHLPMTPGLDTSQLNVRGSFSGTSFFSSGLVILRGGSIRIHHNILIVELAPSQTNLN